MMVSIITVITNYRLPSVIKEIEVCTEVKILGPLQNDPYPSSFISVSKTHRRIKGIKTRKNNFPHKHQCGQLDFYCLKELVQFFF